MAVYEVRSDREAERLVRGLFRRLVISISSLVGITVVSSVMFAVLAPPNELTFVDRFFRGFWDTLNLISTVGSLHSDLTTAQRAWAGLVIIFGLGAVLYAFGVLQALLHGGDVHNHFFRRAIRRTLMSYSNHVVICGFGGVGRVAAERAIAAGTPVIVVESDEEAVEQAASAGLMVVHGDATQEVTLAEAGVARAASLIACLDGDAANVFVMLVARELSESVRLIARGESHASRGPLTRAGAERVVVPGEAAGTHLAQVAIDPAVSEFVEAAIGAGEYDFAAIDTERHPNLAGRSIGSLTSKTDGPGSHDLLVVCVSNADGTQHFNPTDDVTIKSGDQLLVVTRGGDLRAAISAGAS